jgi:hypothetical protein
MLTESEGRCGSIVGIGRMTATTPTDRCARAVLPAAIGPMTNVILLVAPLSSAAISWRPARFARWTYRTTCTLSTREPPGKAGVQGVGVHDSLSLNGAVTVTVPTRTALSRSQ